MPLIMRLIGAQIRRKTTSPPVSLLGLGLVVRHTEEVAIAVTK
jgi:hypothetical protein